MLLLSIRPEYVEKILCGEKRVELRRQRPRCQPNDLIAIYSSTPEKLLVGVARINEVRVNSPECLWHDVRAFAGISRPAFFDYFTGADKAVGLMITNVVPLLTPVTLDDLRTEWPGFHPPQGFRYLTASQIDFVLRNLDSPMPDRVTA